MLRVISLGAGVQSTTMALMAAAGEIGPMPDCAIFADTGWEPKAVYDHLDWLRGGATIPGLSGFGRQSARKPSWRAPTPLAARFNASPGSCGWPTATQIARQCTREFKMHPIQREVRAMADLTGKRSPKGGSRNVDRYLD